MDHHRRLLALLLVALLASSFVMKAHCQRPDDDDSFDTEEEAPSFDDDDDDEERVTPLPAEKSAPIEPEDIDHEEFDSDEFVGVPKKQGTAAPTAASPSTPQADPVEPDEPAARRYMWEIAALVFLAFYLVNYLYGNAQNKKIAEAWINSLQPVFESQFAMLGAYEGQEQQGTIIRDSASCFKFYASGRRHCTGMLATVELRKRHDIFSLLLAAVDFSTTRDTVTMEISMNPDEMEPFVFAVARRKEQKKLRQNITDLSNYAAVVPTDVLPSSLCLMTDCPELDQEFFGDLVLRTLEKYEPFFSLMHFTDQNPLSFNVSKKVLRFTFFLPPPEQMGELRRLTEMAFYFVDRVAAVKLNAQARARALKKRKDVAEKLSRDAHEQRQEAAQRRKEEQKKREEELNASLSKEQLRKKEARDAKKELKKRQPKVKVMRG